MNKKNINIEPAQDILESYPGSSKKMYLMFNIKIKKLRRLILILFVFITNFTGLIFIKIVLAKSTNGLANTSWPMYQHDRSHTGQSTYLGIGTTPQVLWKTQLPFNVNTENGSGIVADDGIIYLTASRSLFAIDSQDGIIKWRQFFEEGWSRSTPALGANGLIHWGFGDTFAAFSNTGQIAWGWTDLSLNYIFGSSPAISDDGSIYANHDALWSFSKDGDINWVYPFYMCSHSSPAIAPDGTIYTSGNENPESGGLYGYLYAFNPDGSVKWKSDIGTTYDNTPTIGDDGTIYIGGDGARLYAFHPDGTQKWVFETDETMYSALSSIGSAPALGTDGTIYFGTHIGFGLDENIHLYAIKPDGTLKWKAPLSWGSIKNAFCACSSPVVDKSNRVYICVDYGMCFGFDSDGTPLWQYLTDPTSLADVRTTPLIASNGTILILDGYDILHAIGDPTLARLHASPRTIDLMIDYGSPPFTFNIQITSTLMPITWSAMIKPNVNWLTMPITNGLTPSTLNILINPSLLLTIVQGFFCKFGQVLPRKKTNDLV